MGMSIDNHVYTIDKVIAELSEKTDKPVRTEFVREVFSRFGIAVNDDQYVVLWNEYWDDAGYNPASQLLYFFGAYYGIEDVWLDYDCDYGGTNAQEVWEDMFPDTDFPEVVEEY